MGYTGIVHTKKSDKINLSIFVCNKRTKANEKRTSATSFKVFAINLITKNSSLSFVYTLTFTSHTRIRHIQPIISHHALPRAISSGGCSSKGVVQLADLCELDHRVLTWYIWWLYIQAFEMCPLHKNVHISPAVHAALIVAA